MNTSIDPFTVPDTAPEMARRFAVIMAGLAALVARRFLRMPHLAGLTLLLWGRLNRAVRRFHRTLTQPAKPRAKLAQAGRVRAGRTKDHLVRNRGLPSGRGWLVRELGWEAAGYMAQLEALLAEPDMRAALATVPGAGRVLRPICRMLGVAAAAAPEVIRRPAQAAWVVAESGSVTDATVIVPVQGLNFSDA